MERTISQLAFYKGKKVLVTGHTGFKGAWLCSVLINAGAQVTGYALEPPTKPNLFDLAELNKNMRSIIGDIRDINSLWKAFSETQPEIVFHMAAQPIVRESYKNPVDTYEINVMGTVNLLECVCRCNCVRSVINVTTDKVYRNNEWVWGYRETDELCGFDPYSNSKSCSELVTESYVNSFLREKGVAVSTARAGNVIGGGDFAKSRIIPDCVKAVMAGKPIIVRNPYSVRPYQHVLEPIYAYLLIAEQQFEHPELAGWYNVGPNEEDCITTGELTRMFCEAWSGSAQWETRYDGGPHEANFLKLDCAKIKGVLGWEPRWNIQRAIRETVLWSKEWLAGRSVVICMEQQIEEFFE